MIRIKSLILRLGLVGLGGLGMGLTSAPVGAWPLAWVTLVPLWVALCQPPLAAKKRRALGLAIRDGFLWGWLYGGVTVHWLWFLHPLTWMGVPWLISLAIAAFAWGVVAITGGLWIGAWAGLFVACRLWFKTPELGLARWGGIIQRLLLGLGLWVGLDTLMQQGILYWPSLAFTQSPVNLAALHLSRLSGPATVSAAIVLANGLLAEAWLQAQRQRSASERASAPASTPTPRTLIVAATVVLISVHGVGLGLLQRSTPGSPLTVGLIQANVPTRIKLTNDGIRRALRGYSRGYHALVDQGAELVVLPEGALPFRWTPTAPRDPLATAIRDRQVAAVVGTFATRDEQLTQSLLAVAGSGEIVGRYDKVKLVPLGEYIPLQNSLGRIVGRLSPIQSDMLPGPRRQILMTPFGAAIAGICYESGFPAAFRDQAAAGGTLIITASNNDPYPITMMAQHHAQDILRAIETDRWAVRATNTGYSGIVDPHGRFRGRANADTYTTKLATVEQRTTQTPYVRWGDWLTPSLVVLAGASLLVPGRR